MKLFIDSASLAEIARINRTGILDGVTTNPSLLAKESALRTQRDIRGRYLAICEELDGGDVSAEVIGTEYRAMLDEGRELAAIHPRIVVKIPMLPQGVRAICALTKEGIRTNCTLIFSVSQALLAAKAGATYVSPFVGRLDDNEESGVGLVDDITLAFANYDLRAQVLAASIRSAQHVTECALAGADVASCPPAVLDAMFKHPLTDAGLEKFLSDYEKIGQQKQSQ